MEKRNPILGPYADLQLRKTIVFVGLMGAGKSNVGRRMAACMNVPFFDSDHEVEAAAGMSVADIFEAHGEMAFRDTERKVIRRLLDHDVCVIAAGGGAFMNAETRETIAEKGKSIWLRAPLEVLVNRTARSNRRPLLNNGDAAKILRDLLEKRYPVYEKADIVIESDERPPDVTVELAIKALIDNGLVVKKPIM